MGFAHTPSLAYNDEDLYDRAKGLPDGMEPPEYPAGCQIMLAEADLEKAEAEGGEPGDTMRFSAMGEVTSTHESMDGCRIELEITRFAGEDGRLFELSSPCHVSLTECELDKMDLDSDCERGDTIHLIGTVRLESRSDTEYSGKMCCLQIVELGWEDESYEARED